VRLLLVTHPACAEHQAGALHPERPARLEAVLEGLRDPRHGARVIELEAPRAARPDLELVHRAGYLEALERFCAAGGGQIDADTWVSEASWEAALRAAGSGPAAVEELRVGGADVAFLAVRPPGHHALSNRAMGFCLLNNIAVTAQLLAQKEERVAIIDWDVHHGNGTQAVFYHRADVLYVSLHEFPAYPGSGWLDETGEGAGVGATFNFPFPAGTGGDVYRDAFGRVVVPLMRRFEPGWVLVSAGYDAHLADPLAGLALVEADYAAMAAVLAGVAPPGRTVFFLEGGYDLDALQGSVTSTVAGAAGRRVPEPAEPITSPKAAWAVLERVSEAASLRWDLG
jgi:acetoin utilization deacetylase AcuC-like enzyme